MAIEDSGFGVQSITLRDNSVRVVENAAATLNILPSLHPVFTSDGKDNVISEENSLNTVQSKYGDDFADINQYDSRTSMLNRFYLQEEQHIFVVYFLMMLDQFTLLLNSLLSLLKTFRFISVMVMVSSFLTKMEIRFLLQL